jgi:catechol 2,3-dioxygenase-like lactoylglutathione lyase family enzyme
VTDGGTTVNQQPDASDVRPGHVVGAVVFVTDLDRSLALYHGALGMDATDPELVGAELAATYGIPEGIGRTVTLSAAGFGAGWVTLVELPDLPDGPAGRTDVMETGRSVTVFQSPSLLAMADEMTALGVPRIAEPDPITNDFGTAREFISFDPDGAAVCLLQIEPVAGVTPTRQLHAPWVPDRENQVSPMVRTSNIVSDLGAALAFYRDVVGMDVFEERDISGEIAGALGMPPCRVQLGYVGVAQSALPTGLCSICLTEITEPSPPRMAAPPATGVHAGQMVSVIAVEDPEAVRRTAQERGIAFLAGGTAFFDPDDNLVAVVGV